MSFYVYAHSKPDGEVFYVGKGSGKRLTQTGNRSLFWKRLVAKHGYVATIMFDNLTEDDAFATEIATIATYKAIGQCVVNFTDGGDGVRVEKRWWGAAISAATRGKGKPSGKNNRSYKDVISKDELMDFYIRDGLTSVQIACLAGVSIPTITARLEEYGIPVRSPGRKPQPVLCVDDGMTFPSISEAARFYGIFRENIRKVLGGIYKTTGSRRFVYA